MDLIGKTVRWENPQDQPGMWFTALVTDGSAMGGSYTGTVIDPGNYRGRLWPFEPFEVGEHVPNLVGTLCTVVDSEPITDDPECE